MSKLYPKSHVEVDGLLARYYEGLLNAVTLGRYGKFVDRALEDMEIEDGDRVLILGSGSGYNAKKMVPRIGKEGEILGLDISETGIREFKKKFKNTSNVSVENRRIDIPLPYESQFDRVFTSFVIHGLPHPAREATIRNANRALVQGGTFSILDYGDFRPAELPFYLRIPFSLAECDYAYDYLSRNWEDVLSNFGFEAEKSVDYFGGFSRLLETRKTSSVSADDE